MISDYDVLLFTETWHSRPNDLHIEGYDYFSCPRPRFNARAKRDSGGVIVYFRNSLRDHIQLVELNSNGAVWFKLLKNRSDVEYDSYFCTCYIPPEESKVYKNLKSSLYEYDFFEYLNTSIRRYSSSGSVFLLCDFNSRTSNQADYVCLDSLDRFVDLPFSNQHFLPTRMNSDRAINTFGQNLLILCKENELSIVNGRLEKGDYTYHGTYRGNSVNSTVDYLITHSSNFDMITNFCVKSLTEFSDHSPVTFCVLYDTSNVQCSDKIFWKREVKDDLSSCLEDKSRLFQNLVDSLRLEEIDINECMSHFSKLVYDISFSLCGKTVYTG